MGENLGAFIAHPALQHLSAYLEVPGVDRQRPERGRDPEAPRPACALDEQRLSPPRAAQSRLRRGSEQTWQESR